MKIRKKLFNRIAGSKRSTPPGPGEEGHEIPPPSAIERISPDSAFGSEESGYGADFELLASDEQTRSDSSSGMDMQENGYGADLELLAAAGADEPPNESGPPREPAQPAGYGPGFELLAGSGADELPDEPEPAQEHGEADSVVAESAVEASASGPEITQESEPEITGDLVPAYEEPLAAAVSDESPDEPEPSGEPGPPREHNLDVELLERSEPSELPDGPEPAQEHGEAATDVAESAVEASASVPEITQESEPEITGDIALKYEEPLAAAVSDESPDEAEPSREQEVSSSIEVAADPPPEQAEEPRKPPSRKTDSTLS